MNMKNADRFAPPERARWQLIASGQPPRASGKGKSLRWEATTDEEGYSLRNGGIVMPREWDLPTGNYYYRFVDSASYSKHSGEGSASPGLFGGWWVEYEVIQSMVSFARSHGELLENVASYFLALPQEWGDRARLFRACLGFPLRAWRGRGHVAQSGSGKYIPPQHLQEIFQCLIPGDPQQRAGAFLPWIPSANLIYTRDFEQCGWFK